MGMHDEPGHSDRPIWTPDVSDARRLVDLLLAVEQELRRLQLWSVVAPPADALRSALPFCYDTLGLEEWLQWVFIPRFRDLLASGAPLPTPCGIAPLAEEYLAARGIEGSHLLPLLEALDALITDHGQRAQH